jgi:hypothetical protein
MVHDSVMSEPKVITFRFTDEELEVLGVIEGHTGIRSRTDALRGVLREHAHPADSGEEKAGEGAPAPEGASKAGKAPPGENPDG